MWSGLIYPWIRTFDRKLFLQSLFQKEAFEIRFRDSDSWNKAEINFLRREKLSSGDYFEYLKKKAKSGDMAVFELTSREVSLGKWSKNWSGYRRKLKQNIE